VCPHSAGDRHRIQLYGSQNYPVLPRQTLDG
jgi:hypothetical protein